MPQERNAGLGDEDHLLDVAGENGSLKAEVTALQEELNHAKALLIKNQPSVMIGRLLGSIAHEINNPLEAVTNLLFLLRSPGTAEADARSYLALAEGEIQRVSEITKQMLSFHRESRVREEISVIEAIESVLALHKGRLRQGRIDVVRQFRSDGCLIAFRGELRQILANLIGNAIDAMPDGGRLVVRLQERGGIIPGLGVTVADTGVGMTREMANQVGNLFLTTKGEFGTGFGMWVTRQLVHKYEGKLQVYSSTCSGRSGTAFRIWFSEPHFRRSAKSSQSSTQASAAWLGAASRTPGKTAGEGRKTNTGMEDKTA
jgi:signal transduction histidine kinase